MNINIFIYLVKVKKCLTPQKVRTTLVLGRRKYIGNRYVHLVLLGVIDNLHARLMVNIEWILYVLHL